MNFDNQYFNYLYYDTAIMLRKTSPALCLPFILLFIPTAFAIMLTFGIFIIVSGFLTTLFDAYLLNRELLRQDYIKALDYTLAKANSDKNKLNNNDKDNYADTIKKIASDAYILEMNNSNILTMDYSIDKQDDTHINNSEINIIINSELDKTYNPGIKDFMTKSNIKLNSIFKLAIVRRIIILLGLLCLIVPGIILSIDYSMSNYLLVINPEIKSPIKLLRMSKDIVSSHRSQYLRLIGHCILPIILMIVSFGTLIPWSLPFIRMMKARFFFDIIHPYGIEPPPYID